MIAPLPPPSDSWDGGPTNNPEALDWRERERRQRTVRLLMMFLLMLLLMDGEESSARRRDIQQLRRKRRMPLATLEKNVFQARMDQEERLHKVTRAHPRYTALVEKNRQVNYELQIRKWALQHEDDLLESNLAMTEETSRLKINDEDPESEKKVFHYPWNATGFYRGEWVRESMDDEEEGSDNAQKAARDEEQAKLENEEIQYLTATELEGPMMELLQQRHENVGVFLLPAHSRLQMGNFTATKTELAAAEVAIESLKARAKNAPKSPFMRVGHPELNVVVETASDDTPEVPQVTLQLPAGRAAFQFYSRPVPAMREMSLVDGFIKLYDSNTVGYSTKRDILLRVRGVLIHSIGRISLVSNASPGRSALIMSDHIDSENRRRRLEESVDALHNGAGEIDQQRIDIIREDVMALDPYHSESDGPWTEMTSFDFDESEFLQNERRDFFGTLLSRFVWANSKDVEIELPRRKLSVAMDEDMEQEIAQLEEAAHSETVETKKLSDDKSKYRRTRSGEESLEEDEAVDNTVGDLKPSKVVIPYPFVPDDKQESIRKTKTPAARRMPPHEQMLEANAGRCEFEINLDVREIEWTVGEWRNLISHRIRETNELDPSTQKKDTDEQDGEDEEDPVGGHLKQKHASPSTLKSEFYRVKPMPDQALVMLMEGSIHSPNCYFTSSLNATAIRTDWEHTTGKAINYSFYMMLTCLTQIVVLLRQLLHTQAQSAATRVSLLSIGWQTVLDALMCLAHIYLSLAMQPLFTAFASVAFFKLLIFCVIEMKYMAIIIQARNASNGGQNTTELLRRQLAMLHLRFYVALMAAFMAFFYAGQKYRTLYILALYSFWVPQIIQNVVTEAKRPLHPYYIYGMSCTRLVAPLYIFAVPNNFLKEVYPDAPTDVFMCELLVLWVGIQASILIAQGRYGARFMVPARFLPPKFDYSRPIPPSMLPPPEVTETPALESTVNSEVETLLPSENSTPERHSSGVTRNRIKGSRASRRNSRGEGTMVTEPIVDTSNTTCGLDCVICYNGIDANNRRGYMLAPCDHIFHRECLVQWMEVKMECPICRTELPAI